MNQQNEVAVRDWKKLGSSYIPALIGDPDMYQTPIEIWQKMTGLKVPDGPSKAELFYWGHKLEKVIVDSWCEDHRIDLYLRNQTFFSGEHYCDTPDGANLDKGIVLEAKNVRSNMAWKWSEGVPKYVFAQCQWHIKHFDEFLEMTSREPSKRCFVRALIGGCEKRDFIVDRDDNFISNLETIAESFINDYVIPKVEPPIDSSEAYKKFLFEKFPEVQFPDEKIFVEITAESDPEAYQSFAELKPLVTSGKEIDQKIQLRKNILMSRIGENYGVRSEFGKLIAPNVKGSVAYKKAIDVLKQRFPELKNSIDDIVEGTRGKNYRKLTPYLK